MVSQPLAEAAATWPAVSSSKRISLAGTPRWAWTASKMARSGLTWPNWKEKRIGSNVSTSSGKWIGRASSSRGALFVRIPVGRRSETLLAIARTSGRTVNARARDRASRAAASQSDRSDTLAPSESGAYSSYPPRSSAGGEKAHMRNKPPFRKMC